MKKNVILFVLLLTFFNSLIFSDDLKLKDRLSSVVKRLDVLEKDAISFWKIYGPDKEYGGFYGTIKKTGENTSPTYKGIIQLGRHLWTFSTWYERRESTPEIKAICDDLYDFIVKYLIDKKNNEFYFNARKTGTVGKPEKMLYSNSVAIYALSQYSIVFKNEEAAEHAYKCFKAIDSRTYDKKYKGYDQSNEPNWLAGGAKGTNTILHLIESFAKLFEATGNKLVKKRLNELINIFINKMIQEEDYVHKEFKRDWKTFGGKMVNYGHDLEIARHVFEAAKVLGRENEESIVDGIVSIGVLSSEEGYDEENGGYFYEGIPNGEVTNFEKIWWVQAESIASLWWMFILTEDQVHLDRLEGTINWIENFQKDKKSGEWFWEVNSKGEPVGSYKDIIGNEWKASYHLMRGLIHTKDWITEYLNK